MTKMGKALVEILVEAGLEREGVETLMRKVVKMARRDHTPLVNTLRKCANPGAHMDSIEYHLHLALQNVNARIARLN